MKLLVSPQITQPDTLSDLEEATITDRVRQDLNGMKAAVFWDNGHLKLLMDDKTFTMFQMRFSGHSFSVIDIEPEV